MEAVSHQNRPTLDLLTAEKGGTCIFLGEEHGYFVHQSEIVTTKVRELRERIQRRQQEGKSLWKGWDFASWTTWLPALAGNFLSIILPVTIDPCFLNTLERFSENTVTHQTAACILTLQGYQSIRQKDNAY